MCEVKKQKNVSELFMFGLIFLVKIKDFLGNEDLKRGSF